MISLYVKNRPWNGHPRPDYIHVLAESPEKLAAYRIDGGRLAEEPLTAGFMRRYQGWYHPATSWEMEEYRRLGGKV